MFWLSLLATQTTRNQSDDMSIKTYQSNHHWNQESQSSKDKPSSVSTANVGGKRGHTHKKNSLLDAKYRYLYEYIIESEVGD